MLTRKAVVAIVLISIPSLAFVTRDNPGGTRQSRFKSAKANETMLPYVRKCSFKVAKGKEGEFFTPFEKACHYQNGKGEEKTADITVAQLKRLFSDDHYEGTCNPVYRITYMSTEGANRSDHAAPDQAIQKLISLCAASIREEKGDAKATDFTIRSTTLVGALKNVEWGSARLQSYILRKLGHRLKQKTLSFTRPGPK